MKSGTKVALVVIFAIVAGLGLLVGGGGYFVYYGGFGSTLKSSAAPITMHNAAALNTHYYVDRIWQCRMRFPKGKFDVSPESATEANGGFQVQCEGCNFTILQSTRGFRSFEAFVSSNKTGILHASSLKDVHIVQEGRTTINGLPGYVLDITCTVMGIEIHECMVLLDAGDKRVYLIVGACASDKWPLHADAVQSCISTFQVGDFPEDPN